MKQAALWTQCRQILGAVALATLAACGGGGGGDSPVASSAVSLSGVASKGLLRNAQVTIHRVNDDGSLTLLATTTTNSKGDYTFTNLPVNANVLVTVTAIAGTTMVDEATNTIITPAPGFTLRAGTQLASSVAGSDNQLQVTPFSEMAVRRAEAVKEEGSADTLASLILAANAELTGSLGFNPLTEKPVFVADGDTADAKPANAAALALAALSYIADQGSVDCDDDTSAGRIACVVDGLADSQTISGSLKTLLDEAIDVAADDEGYEGTAPTITPLPEGTELIGSTTTSAIAAAKALFTTLRNEASTLTTLGQDVDAVQATFQAATAPVAHPQVELIDLLLQSINQFDRIRAEAYVGDFFMPADELISPEAGQRSGCTVYADDTFSTEASIYEDIVSMVCRVTHGIRGNGNGYTLTQHQAFVTQGTTPGTYNVKTRIIEQDVDGNFNWVGSPRPLSQRQTNPVQVSVTRNAEGAPASLVLDGDLGVGLSNDLVVQTSTNRVLLSAVPTTANGITTYALQGNIDARNGNTVTSSVAIKQGSQLTVSFSTAGDPTSGITSHSNTAAVLVLEATTGSSASVTGTLRASSVVLDVTQSPVPQQLSFQGVIKNATRTLFDGTLSATLTLGTYDRTQNESANNFLAKSVTLTGQAFPATGAAVTLNLTLAEATYGAYTFSGSYSRGTPLVSIVGQGSRLNNTQQLTITSGVASTTLNSNSPYSDVTVNGTVRVGQLDRDTGRINYADGTFESF